MKYYISTPELDAQISEIRRKIRLSMNGVVSDSMTQSGIIYKKNFGVNIPRIKEIAAGYTPGHDLAQRLWSLQIRETMIMATLLEPIDKFSMDLAQKWVEEFDQIEIIEQSVMNLFCKLEYSNELCKQWIQNDKIWIQISGFILAARTGNKLSHDSIELIIEKGLELSETDNFHLYKAIALCFSRFCRLNKETALYISDKIKYFVTNSSVSQQFISNDVTQEILFLGIL